MSLIDMHFPHNYSSPAFFVVRKCSEQLCPGPVLSYIFVWRIKFRLIASKTNFSVLVTINGHRSSLFIMFNVKVSYVWISAVPYPMNLSIRAETVSGGSRQVLFYAMPVLSQVGAGLKCFEVWFEKLWQPRICRRKIPTPCVCVDPVCNLLPSATTYVRFPSRVHVILQDVYGSTWSISWMSNWRFQGCWPRQPKTSWYSVLSTQGRKKARHGDGLHHMYKSMKGTSSQHVTLRTWGQQHGWIPQLLAQGNGRGVETSGMPFHDAHQLDVLIIWKRRKKLSSP